MSDPTTPEGRAELRAMAEKTLEDWSDPESLGAWWEQRDLAYHDINELDAEFIAATSPTVVLALLDELERTKRGAQTLGRIIERHGRAIVEATGAHDLINEDGDGDWEVVFERLAELRPARDRARQSAQARAETIHQMTQQAIDATGAHHLITEGGEVDWAVVSELLAELRPARDAAIARAEKAEAELERGRELMESGARVLDNHAEMLSKLVMDTPKDQELTDRLVHLTIRSAAALRAALDGDS
jgi:hypothetical protein